MDPSFSTETPGNDNHSFPQFQLSRGWFDHDLTVLDDLFGGELDSPSSSEVDDLYIPPQSLRKPASRSHKIASHSNDDSSSESEDENEEGEGKLPYQIAKNLAPIPSLDPSSARKSPGDTLMWDPTQISDNNWNCFFAQVSALFPQHRVSQEKLMIQLHSHSYATEDILQLAQVAAEQLKPRSPILPIPINFLARHFLDDSVWTKYEKEIFEVGMEKYEEEEKIDCLKAIQRMIKTKDLGSVYAYFYRWKATRRDQWFEEQQATHSRSYSRIPLNVKLPRAWVYAGILQPKTPHPSLPLPPAVLEGSNPSFLTTAFIPATGTRSLPSPSRSLPATSRFLPSPTVLAFTTSRSEEEEGEGEGEKDKITFLLQPSVRGETIVSSSSEEDDVDYYDAEEEERKGREKEVEDSSSPEDEDFLDVLQHEPPQETEKEEGEGREETEEEEEASGGKEAEDRFLYTQRPLLDPSTFLLEEGEVGRLVDIEYGLYSQPPSPSSHSTSSSSSPHIPSSPLLVPVPICPPSSASGKIRKRWTVRKEEEEEEEEAVLKQEGQDEEEQDQKQVQKEERKEEQTEVSKKEERTEEGSKRSWEGQEEKTNEEEQEEGEKETRVEVRSGEKKTEEVTLSQPFHPVFSSTPTSSSPPPPSVSSSASASPTLRITLEHLPVCWVYVGIPSHLDPTLRKRRLVVEEEDKKEAKVNQEGEEAADSQRELTEDEQEEQQVTGKKAKRRRRKRRRRS